MGRKRITEYLSGRDALMHDLILTDLQRKDSLILANLIEKYTELSNASPDNTGVSVKDIFDFLRIYQDRKISDDNAVAQIKSTIMNRLSNIRISSYNDKRASFKIPEILAYCKMLCINPETILRDTSTPTFLLPVQYCSAEQVILWLRNARYEKPRDIPTRISYRSAPIIGVSIDIYFSYNRDKLLDDMIKKTFPYELEFPSKKSNENYVQLQAFITGRGNYSVPTFLIGVLKIPSQSTRHNKDIKAYLQHADHYFFSMCRRIYKKDQDHLRPSVICSDDNVFAQYYSDTFAKIFKTYLANNDTLMPTPHDKIVFPKSYLLDHSDPRTQLDSFER